MVTNTPIWLMALFSAGVGVAPTFRPCGGLCPLFKEPLWW